MKTTAILAAVLVLVPLVLTSQSASADGGPMAEVRLGTDVGLSKPPWLMRSVLVGWRISEQWSAGVSYSPLRVIHQDMQVLNDVSAAPISLSGLHAYGEFWFKTHASWGGGGGRGPGWSRRTLVLPSRATTCPVGSPTVCCRPRGAS